MIKKENDEVVKKNLRSLRSRLDVSSTKKENDKLTKKN